MSNKNLGKNHLSEEKVAKIKQHLTALEQELADLNASLTPEDRKRLGSINEQNKLFVNRDYDFAKNQPELRSPQVDWEEFEKDFKSREILTSFIDRLEVQLQKLKSERILHDHDNYQDGLIDYAYTNFMVGAGASQYETKQKELAQFFTRANKKTPPPVADKNE